MQPYQNYYAGQMPMYNQQMQPNVNPYMQRMDQLQQFQQNIQQPMVSTSMSGTNQFMSLGKIVESIDIVKTTDIPMDGNTYYFPKADGTEVYSKHWMPNGTTQILTFKPILENEPNNSTHNQFELNFGAISEVLSGIQNDVKELANKVDKISKPSRAKKEVADDE